MGQNQSHVAIFYIELNMTVLGHIQCFELVKTRGQYLVCVRSY